MMPPKTVRHKCENIQRIEAIASQVEEGKVDVGEISEKMSAGFMELRKDFAAFAKDLGDQVRRLDDKIVGVQSSLQVHQVGVAKLEERMEHFKEGLEKRDEEEARHGREMSKRLTEVEKQNAKTNEDLATMREKTRNTAGVMSTVISIASSIIVGLAIYFLTKRS